MVKIPHKLHKVIHHLRHTRPRWYDEYHKWKHYAVLHWITFALSSIVIFMGFVNALLLIQQYPLQPVGADTGATTITANVNAGTLSIAPPASANLSAVNVDVASSQNSTGSLGTVTVTDNRGSGVGWSATATSSHFYKYQNPVMTGGSNNTVSVGAGSTFYTGTAGTYTITITGGGAVGVATYSVEGPGSDNNSGTTGTDVNIGSKGLKATFASATYTTSDSWTIRVDTIPVTGFQITPGSLTTIAGSSTNVTGGSIHTFSNTSDSTSLITASSAGGYGMGSYSVTPDLQLTIPANSYANSYTATLTMTVN